MSAFDRAARRVARPLRMRHRRRSRIGAVCEHHSARGEVAEHDRRTAGRADPRRHDRRRVGDHGANGFGDTRTGDIPERPKDYPDPTVFGLLPASGLYVRHATEIPLRGIQFRRAYPAICARSRAIAQTRPDR
ncbi:MAG: hypothetical protein C5B56_15475 [Proteobacteria bacterium]|nr:MAG: hypothetical protein C5B56_15475 [Pseudomonadota bacterium]